MKILGAFNYNNIKVELKANSEETKFTVQRTNADNLENKHFDLLDLMTAKVVFENEVKEVIRDVWYPELYRFMQAQPNEEI